MKRKCSKCEIEKPFSDFTKDNRKPYGIGYCCLVCKNNQIKENYHKNPEARRKYAVGYRNSHHEETIKNSRAWYKNNKEKARELNQAWQLSHRDRINEGVRNRNRVNPFPNRARTKLYRARKLGNGGEVISEKDWLDLCKKYENKCLSCHKDCVALTQDHVLPVSLGGGHFLGNIQPLCKSCNSKKGARHIDYRPTAEAAYA